MNGRAVVVITHCPSTTELAERVAVLDDGVVVEEGTIEEMREGDVSSAVCSPPERGHPRAGFAPPGKAGEAAERETS